MGPVIIFDKSMLQSLSVDESCWLENFFLSNMTPLFYVESLADLSKEIKGSRTSEEFVSQLAERTPTMNCYPNIHHLTLIYNELLGKEVPMDGRILIAGGEIKTTKDGQTLTDYKEFPENEGLTRWKEEKFTELENEFASQWRTQLSNLNFNDNIALVKNIVPSGVKLRSLVEIRGFVEDFIVKEDEMILELLFSLLDINISHQQLIRHRWKQQNPRNLTELAPYTSFVLKIDIFFYLAVHLGQISGVRRSNKIDISYLYYLPFCNVFSSSDKLHIRVAHLFMNGNQEFINGKDFKKAMKWLDDYYSKFPDRIKKQGLTKFAIYPPKEKNLVSDLWDIYLTLWRKHLKEKISGQPKSGEEKKELVDKINIMRKESIPLAQELEATAIDSILFTKKSKLKKGKWKLFPPEVEENLRLDEK